jgi:hypothetical protein
VRAIKSVSRRVGRTKTGAKKYAPVHPALDVILRDRLEHGWRGSIGRNPMRTTSPCRSN